MQRRVWPFWGKVISLPLQRTEPGTVQPVAQSLYQLHCPGSWCNLGCVTCHTRHSPVPDESTPYHYTILFQKDLHILHLLLGFPRCLFSSYFPSKPEYIFLTFPRTACSAHLSTLHFITYMCLVNSTRVHYKVPHYVHALRAGGFGKPIPVGVEFSEPLQTGSGAQPASHTVGIWSLSRE